MTEQPAAFTPPAAECLPPGALNSATDGASALDAWARTPIGRNFLAHTLVQLARDGWLRTEPGEGFEAVRDRETPEPEDAASAGPAPAADQAAAPTDWIDGHPQLEAIAAAVWEQCRTEGTSLVVDDPRNIAVAALAAVVPAPADRAAVLREAAGRVLGENRRCTVVGLCQPCLTRTAVSDLLRRMADETQQPEPRRLTDPPLYGAAEIETRPELNITPLTGDQLHADEQVAEERLRCPRCREDITDYDEDDHVFRTGDERPYCSGECVIAAHRTGLPTADEQAAAVQQPKEARP